MLRVAYIVVVINEVKFLILKFISVFVGRVTLQRYIRIRATYVKYFSCLRTITDVREFDSARDTRQNGITSWRNTDIRNVYGFLELHFKWAYRITNLLKSYRHDILYGYTFLSRDFLTFSRSSRFTKAKSDGKEMKLRVLNYWTARILLIKVIFSSPSIQLLEIHFSNLILSIYSMV